MSRRLHLTAALLCALPLAGCAGEPQPDPEEFWSELTFFTDLPEDYRAQAVDDGMWACSELAGAPRGDQDGLEHAAGSWTAWADEMGSEDAGFFWETAVEHLCPGQAETLERVQEYDGALRHTAQPSDR